MGRNQTYEIHEADAFSWLRCRGPNSVHAVVTDPPYALIEYSPKELQKRRNGSGGIWRLPQAFDGHDRSPMPRFTVLRPVDLARLQRFHSRLAPLLSSVLVPGGMVIMSSQNLISHIVIRAFTTAGFEMRGQVARVVKTLRGGDRPKGAHEDFPYVSVSPRSCWEPWLIFRKPLNGTVSENLKEWKAGGLRRPEDGKPFSDLIVSSPCRGEERRAAPHPSLKPQAFMRQIVRAALPLGSGTVVDPFMGSGSTIAAASYLGYRSIGVERDAQFFKMAQKAIPQLSKIEIPASGNGTKRQH
ncbi:MAG: site-specific DNA-methyltransferase [Candidatus Sulfotelmatobacter sp.]